MWYEIDYKQLVGLLLPTDFRKRKQAKWLYCLLTPLMQLHYHWKLNRDRNRYKLQHNGQACYLRKVLNDQFDPDQRRIIITDGQRYKRQYIYTHAEERPKYLGTMYLRPSSDYQDSGADFLVLLPKGLVYDTYDMKALIDFYKLASKRYRTEKI